MEETIQISSFSVTIIGSSITIMLCIIAVFLSRLLRQFDELNQTLIKIDKDLSRDVGVLKSRIQEFDPMWDRLRSAENAIVAIQSGGCDAYHSKLHAQ